MPVISVCATVRALLELFAAVALSAQAQPHTSEIAFNLLNEIEVIS